MAKNWQLETIRTLDWPPAPPLVGGTLFFARVFVKVGQRGSKRVKMMSKWLKISVESGQNDSEWPKVGSKWVKMAQNTFKMAKSMVKMGQNRPTSLKMAQNRPQKIGRAHV